MQVNDCGYIIPFKKSLANFVQQPEVWEEITSDHSSDTEIWEDFCDGDFLRNNQFVQYNKPCLQIVINTDSLEIVNPIGAHVKKHKVDVFYWTIANIRPALRSKWNNIHLLSVCKTDHLKKHGLDGILSDFIATVQELHTGIVLNINGRNETIFGILVAAIADTPAAAFLANMKQSYFAKKFCRTCNINTEDMQTKIKISELQERNPRIHKERCKDLQTMPDRLKPYWSKCWGINGTSPLLALPDFNIAISMPQDPMHILMEGILGYGTALILQIAINERYFDLNWLNSQLKAFPYLFGQRQ